MPAPIKPSDLCSAVPSATSSLCDRIQAVFLRMPRLLCEFFTYMLNEDGTLTDTFIRDVAAIPVGMIMPRASSAVPFGWLLCNGAEVDRAGSYAALFAVIGTQHGVGNGTTTFNLPNVQRRFLRGFDPSDGALLIGATGGEEDVVLTANNLPASIPLTATLPGNRTNEESGGPQWLAPMGSSGASITTPTEEVASFPFVNTNGDDGHNNLPPFMAVAWMIKY